MPKANYDLIRRDDYHSVADVSGGGGGGYGGNDNIFGGKKNSSNARGKKLVKLIEAIVEPRIWSVNGGPASIVYFEQRLIITAPVYVQDEIGGP